MFSGHDWYSAQGGGGGDFGRGRYDDRYTHNYNNNNVDRPTEYMPSSNVRSMPAHNGVSDTHWSRYSSIPPPNVPAHGSHGFPELRQNIEFVESQNMRLKEEINSLKSGLETAHSKLRQPDPEAMRDIQRLRDEITHIKKQYLEEKQQKESIEHKFHQIELGIQNDKTAHELERKAWELTETKLKKQMDMEREAANEKFELERTQKQREIESLRKDKDVTQTSHEKHITQLEGTITKLRDQADADHVALTEAQSNINSLSSKIENHKSDNKRKDELNGLLAKENEAKQDRIDESLRLVSTMQSKTNDLESKINEYENTLARTEEAVESAKKTQSALERQLEQERQDSQKWRLGYSKICEVIGASDVEVRGLQATSVASALVEKVAELEHSLVKKDLEISEEKNNVEASAIKVSEAEREMSNHKEALLHKEDECSKLEEELYTTMRELREYMAKCEEHDKTIAIASRRNKEATQTIEKKDLEISRLYEDLKEKESKLLKATTTWTEERMKLEESAKQELTVLAFDHKQRIAQLEKDLVAADAVAKEQGNYADMCDSLAKLLMIGHGYDIAANTRARQIFEAVETHVNEKTELEECVKDRDEQIEGLKKQVNHLELQVQEAVDHYRQVENEALSQSRSQMIDNPWDSTQSTRRLLISHKLEDSALAQSLSRTDNGAHERLREEGKILRSKMAKINHQHHEFLRNIAKALGLKQDPGDVVNPDVLVQQVRDIMEERIDRPIGHRNRKGGNQKTEASSHIELIQSKYRTALRTIQTYDKILADLKKRFATDDLSSSNRNLKDGQALSYDLLLENHELVKEVNELKEQLYSTQDHTGLFDLGTDNLDDVRIELKKYAQFYDELCSVLNYRHNPTFAEVVDKVRKMSKGGDVLKSGKFTTVHRPFSGSRNRSVVPDYTRSHTHVGLPHRPIGTPKTIRRKELPVPWK